MTAMTTFYKPGKMRSSTMQGGDVLINTSTFSPAHCGILVDSHQVVHATNDGIVRSAVDMWSSQADVFRPTPALTAAELAKVANIAEEIRDSAAYGLGRAMFKSTFSSGGVGSGAMSRLNKYRERLHDHQGVVKHVYCSELVIISYQLAWIAGDRIDATHRLFIQLDGKHVWPSTLRRYLNGNINWANRGTFDPA
jgi:hypothetical protein